MSAFGETRNPAGDWERASLRVLTRRREPDAKRESKKNTHESGSKHSFRDQRFPQDHCFIAVDLKQPNGCAANRRATYQARTIPAKVPVPAVPSRMIQTGELPRPRSIPAISEPLKELQYQHAIARLLAIVAPPCLRDKIGSISNGTEVNPSGNRQYSHRPAARSRTNWRSSVAISVSLPHDDSSAHVGPWSASDPAESSRDDSSPSRCARPWRDCLPDCV